ncbi:PEP-CTERM sorting domain-containing protein [Piscinibacter gummiphilus]|uniref:Ice-binding protein C-terminal domain-containing protein n=1 Tax=Piscinibacter gummiphilus TaxID=946333 RepID=A0A1W6L9V6_9BURK|nr:PEP-CTERM sorting domain-containing protein [Piscinibacter gummiphilus]ARN21079.1 hypothetical protein A4W93_14910 [Piscinibacter gummiphilus]ATU65757.1 PEP-CTERM sorting domain-containing protein [Piscinibacter gummiphilus]GLS93626.1 hypothetical protein GCM10007918_09170 [Piscinibacter gummiphilus]
MNTKIHAVRSAALAALFCAAANAATAGLAELRWASRDGEGLIVFDQSVPDSDPTFNEGLFIGTIVSYNVLGWDENMVPARFAGTGGTMFKRAWPSTTCPATFDCPEESYTTLIQLGTATPGAPSRWQVNFNLAESGEPDEHLPFFEDGRGWSYGHLSNPSQTRTYSTLGLAGYISLSPLATPVPEPGTLALFGLGLAAIAGRRAIRGHGDSR